MTVGLKPGFRGCVDTPARKDGVSSGDIIIPVLDQMHEEEGRTALALVTRVNKVYASVANYPGIYAGDKRSIDKEGASAHQTGITPGRTTPRPTVGIKTISLITPPFKAGVEGLEMKRALAQQSRAQVC